MCIGHNKHSPVNGYLISTCDTDIHTASVHSQAAAVHSRPQSFDMPISFRMFSRPSVQTLYTGTSLIYVMSIHARTPFLTYADHTLFGRTSRPIVTAVCLPDWSWMNNEKSQSPCTVAAWVEATCGSSVLRELTSICVFIGFVELAP